MWGRQQPSKDQWTAAKEQEELMSTNPSRPWGAASDANQEATWCERGQINATELTVARDRCFLNGTHHTRTYTRVQIHTHLQTILGLLLISSFSYVRGFPRHPAHAHTHASSDKRGRGEEDKQAKEDGGQGTHADKPDNRQETLESSRSYFLSSSQFPFWTKQVGEKQHSHEKKDKHQYYENVK